MIQLPWDNILRDFATHIHLTASDVLDGQTWAEFHGLWLGGGTVRKEHDSDAINAKIRKRRAELGLTSSSKG